MPASKKKLSPAKRLAAYRRRARKSGLRRVEVAVPATDVALIRNFARAFREGGSTAERLRHQAGLKKQPAAAKTGAELVAFLQNSPLARYDVDLTRDRSPIPDIEF